MNEKPTEDYSTQRFSTDNFDCELPPKARAEFFAPKRAPQKQFPWLRVAIALVLFVAMIGSLSHLGSVRRTKPNTVPESLGAIPPAVAPAPRAELTKLPPPKAKLVAMPWPIGSKKLITMPYNIQVAATFRGVKSSETALPKSGNRIGDFWMVGTTPWLWVAAPGTTVPAWVDP
jgi:hypothetical protein